MPQLNSPNQNHLIAALPTDDYERLAPHLQLVPMPLGEVLYEPGEQLQHAYFPTTAIVSLHYVMETGASAETAGVGNEGVVGIALFMGGDTTPSSAVVKTAGHAYRLERRLLKQEFDRAGAMQRLFLRYTQALITQMTFSDFAARALRRPAGKLQHAGYIRYRRGHIAVLDRSGLEKRACECYAVVRKELGRLLSDVQRRQDIAIAV